jgi:hypothetical protein
MMNGVKRMMKEDDAALGIWEIATEMMCGETMKMFGAYCGTALETCVATGFGITAGGRVCMESIFKIIRLIIA